MMTMDSCSTDLGELDVLSCDDSTNGSFVEEYSVRVEVYETEVSGSGSTGSAPVIKISGLCESGDISQEYGPERHMTSRLKRSLVRLLGDKTTREMPCLPLSKSLQLMECHRRPSMTVSATTCCMTHRDHRSQTTVLAPCGDHHDRLHTSRPGVISDKERLCKARSTHSFASRKNISMATGKTCALDRWHTLCNNPPMRRHIFDSLPRKGSTAKVMKQEVFAVPTKIPRKPSSKSMFTSKSFRTANSHARYFDHTDITYDSKPHCCASREHTFKSHNRKNGTARIIPTRMSRCSWETVRRCHIRKGHPSSTDRMRTFLEPKCCRKAGTAKKSTFQRAASRWPLSRTSFDCFEETITTRLIPASFTKPSRLQSSQKAVCCYVHDDMKTSLKQAWGCTDLSVIHKILPPQQQNSTWTAARPNRTEPMLREVYVSPCERYQGTISSMGFMCAPKERDVPIKLKQATSAPQKASLVRSTTKLSMSHNARHGVNKQTQTSASQLELPKILNSLVDWFSLACQNLGAPTKPKHLPNASQQDIMLPHQELLRTDSAAWWKAARQIHEGITEFAQQATAASACVGRQRSHGTFQPQAMMGGKGECASVHNDSCKLEIPVAQLTKLPGRLASRLDLCIEANTCAGLEDDLVTRMTGLVVTHRRSCPSF
ncbi:unnamed protein product [Ixodes hexagonus]